MLRIQILWRSGAVTETATERLRHVGQPAASEAVVAEIRMRTADGWSDRAIAQDLNRRGVVSPKGLAWNRQSVRGLRKRHNIRSLRVPPEGGGRRKSRRASYRFVAWRNTSGSRGAGLANGWMRALSAQKIAVDAVTPCGSRLTPRPSIALNR